MNRVVRACLAVATLFLWCGATAGVRRAEASETRATLPRPGDFGRLVDIGGGRRLYLECHGTAWPCVLPDHGRHHGRSDQRRVTIRFRNDDFRLTSVRPNRRAVLGKYDVGSGRWRRKHSEYRTSLDAVQAIPRGARLIIAFRAPNPN